jgi:hypothetical protein
MTDRHTAEVLRVTTALYRHSTLAGVVGNEWAAEQFRFIADTITANPALAAVRLAQLLIAYTEGEPDALDA